VFSPFTSVDAFENLDEEAAAGSSGDGARLNLCANVGKSAFGRGSGGSGSGLSGCNGCGAAIAVNSALVTLTGFGGPSSGATTEMPTSYASTARCF
jgi:hypothetical protein